MVQMRFPWMIWLITGLLFLLFIGIFLPGLAVREEVLVDASVAANEYAMEDSELSDAKEIVEDYGYDGDVREKLLEAYEKKLDASFSDRALSRLFFAKWLLRTKLSYQFPGVVCEEEEELSDMGLVFVARFWGCLILFPFLLNVCVMVFTLAKKRVYSVLLLLDASFVMVCELLARGLVPGMVWSCMEDSVKAFPLIDSEVLAIEGVGAFFIKKLFAGCVSGTWIYMLVFAGFLFCCSVFCLVFDAREKKRQVQSADGTEIGDKILTQDDIQKKTTLTRKYGVLQFIRGEYIGQTLEIHPGEELVLGRDPAYSMLVFSNPKVSRRQCGIRYDEGTGCYLAVDFSTAGTGLSDGRMLQTAGYTRVMAGTVFYFAGGEEAFTVL